MGRKVKITKKVCIVDDEPDIREIYQTALEKDGFQVVVAKDGVEGFEVIKSEKPDIALIDIMMPGRGGIELIEEIRKNKETVATPIIVMTNLEDKETIEKVGQYDTSFYLVKSLYDPAKVSSIVREVLERR